MTPAEFEKLLDRYTRQECSLQEEEYILSWYEKIGAGENLEIKEEYRIVLEAKLWSRIESRIKSTKKPQSRPFGKNSWYWRAAAILLIMSSIGALYLLPFQFSKGTEKLSAANDDEQTHIINDKNIPFEVVLEEGSRITLQPASEIRFAKKFKDKKREVYLKGEAFFQVTKDPVRPFFVYAKDVVTRVLGTSFNIRAYQDSHEVNVAVRTGVVSVTSKVKTDEGIEEKILQEVILKPNQEAVYNVERENLFRKIVEVPRIILPKPTLFKMKYDGASVSDIFKVLEENYGIDIVFDEQIFSGCILTTAFADEGLYERIEVICKAIGAEYTMSDGVIVVSGNGCQ
ncbi:MAG TPA: FecR domain-containing protein [Cyclobacteriaceae bacterium]|nr:FecR domain-containing protein [Cyclobacteriaceae bacterium]